VKTIDLTEIHTIELEMLKAVAALCDRYSLRYSIYCGTLLGAVRHKGFIPWDDDIDLAMPLEDYRWFLEHADELPPGISCIHCGNTRDFTRFWAKVAADGTTFMPVELAGMDIHWGISLDIYPMIGTPDTLWGRKIHKGLLLAACKLQLAPKYRVTQAPGFIKTVIAHLPLFVRRLAIRALLPFCLLEPDKAVRVGTIDAEPFEGKYNWADWQEMIRLPFEDASFWAPARYDGILRRMYGNYMQLPPEEARTAHIKGDVIIDPHRDYRLYRKELLGK
jgi:lipopolysaccharide cholinephosphotransferase